LLAVSSFFWLQSFQKVPSNNPQENVFAKNFPSIQKFTPSAKLMRKLQKSSTKKNLTS